MPLNNKFYIFDNKLIKIDKYIKIYKINEKLYALIFKFSSRVRVIFNTLKCYVIFSI